MLSGLECHRCSESACLQFVVNKSLHKGFAQNVSFRCCSCEHIFSEGFTSPRSTTAASGPNPFTVNDMVTMFLNELGVGHTAAKTLGAIFGMPVMHVSTFQQKQCKINRTQCEISENIMQHSAAVVKDIYRELDPDIADDQPIEITVSYDGSWSTRGYKSQYGIGAVIDVQTGLVLDYEVLSKYCQVCTKKQKQLGSDSEEYGEWFTSHKDSCCINFSGSSGSMEVEIAKQLWARSLRKHNLKYTHMLSDGDSKAYNAVVSMDPYDSPIEREECINHAHKRMGTSLIKLSQKGKLGGRGFGKLTQAKALKFQMYYRGAIINNVGNPDGMRTAIWATLQHCMSTDEEPLHNNCPVGSDSWCFYQKAVAADVDPPPHKASIKFPISKSVAEAMIPVYTRMSDPNLLKRLAKGKTQNPNECLHSVVWSRCPKTVFVGKNRLDGAVARGVSVFNSGASQLSTLMESLAVEVNEITAAFINAEDSERTRKARYSGTEKRKLERRVGAEGDKLKRAKLQKDEGTSYSAGAF